MFGNHSFISDLPAHTHSLHHSQAFFFRFKSYSAPYHDFLIDTRQGRDEVLPAGCVEVFCNSLHLMKEKIHLPILATILRHVMPLHLKSSPHPSDTSSLVTVSHNDYFMQCGISDFSLSFVTSSSLTNPFISAPSQQLVIQLKNLSVLFYNNYLCPCCPRDSGECVVSVTTNGLAVMNCARSSLTLSQFTFHFVNNSSELSINSFCDDLRISLDSLLLSTVTIVVNELLSCFSHPFIQSFSLPHTYSLTLASFYLYTRILKDNGILTSRVKTQAKAMLHSLQLTADETLLVSYPAPTALHDSMTNAFELMLRYEGKKSSDNVFTCVSAVMLFDVFNLSKLVRDVLTFGKEVVKTSTPGAQAPKQPDSIPSELPSSIEFNINLKECLLNMHTLSIVTDECMIVLQESICLRLPSMTVMNSAEHSDEFSVIMKQFVVDMDNPNSEPFLVLSDLCILANLTDWTLTLSSSDFSCMVTPTRIQNFMALSSYYSSQLARLRADIATITHSIEEVEVVTDNTVFLSNSLERSSSIDSYGLRRRRSSVSRTSQVQQEIPIVVDKSEEAYEGSMLSKIRVSYALEKVTVVLNCEETERPIGQFHTLVLGHLNMSGDNKEGEIIIQTIQMHSSSQLLLQSNREAMTLHFGWSPDLEVNIGVNAFTVMVRLEIVHSLLRDALYCVSLIPSSPSQSQPEESCRLTATFSVTDSILQIYSNLSQAYQLKVVMLQLRYDQLRTGSQLLNLQLQHLFLADTSNRLLVTDCGLQIDVERIVYRTSNEVTVQIELPDLQLAIHLNDIDTLVSLVLEAYELFKSNSTSSVTLPDSSLRSDYAVKMLVHGIHAQMLNSLHTLSFSLEQFHASYDTQCEDMSARLVSLASLHCELDGQSWLTVGSLPQEKDEMICLCIDREVREKEARIWHYLFLGDFYSRVTPGLLQFLVDSYNLLLPLTRLSNTSSTVPPSPSPLSTPSSTPSSTSLQPNTNQKHGFSLVTQSLQCCLAVPDQSSFLFAAHSLSGMHTATVTHLELNQCSILTDIDSTTLDISLFATSSISNQHRVLEECTLSLNVDTDSSTSHIAFDTGDIILTIDDRIISHSSLLLQSFSSILSSIPSTTNLPPSTPSKPFHFNFMEESEQPNDLPEEFSLSSLTLLIQDSWPEVGQLVVIPTMIPPDKNISEDHVTNFPSLDYYRIVNGGIPQPQSSEALRNQLRHQYLPQMKRSSFFSFLSSSSEEACSPCYVSMQFRLAHTVRVFSVMVASLVASEIDSFIQPGFSQLLGGTLEFDLLAWSDVDRCFRCVKTVCVPIESSFTPVNRDRSLSVANSYRDGEYRSNTTSATDTSGSTLSEALSEQITTSTSTTEFFELAAPYSYSNRYQINVYLRSYRPSLVKKLGGMNSVIRHTAELICHAVSLTYFISFQSLL